MSEAVRAACIGGATSIELCARMDQDGLTPTVAQISIALKAIIGKVDLNVMIRPRRGDFIYSSDELDIMRRQIQQAVDAGADGVVFGVLTDDGQIDHHALKFLLAECVTLKSTFHRALDATVDRFAAIDALIDLGVDRMLTSGTTWGSDLSAVDGMDLIQQMVEHANGRIEILIGGGVNAESATRIVSAFNDSDPVGLHAWSAALEAGLVTSAAVQALRNCIDPF